MTIASTAGCDTDSRCGVDEVHTSVDARRSPSTALLLLRSVASVCVHRVHPNYSHSAEVIAAKRTLANPSHPRDFRDGLYFTQAVQQQRRTAPPPVTQKHHERCRCGMAAHKMWTWINSTEDISGTHDQL